MVEQTRRPSHAVSLQAGPGEVDSGPHSPDSLLRYSTCLPARLLWSSNNPYKKATPDTTNSTPSLAKNEEKVHKP